MFGAALGALIAAQQQAHMDALRQSRGMGGLQGLGGLQSAASQAASGIQGGLSQLGLGLDPFSRSITQAVRAPLSFVEGLRMEIKDWLKDTLD